MKSDDKRAQFRTRIVRHLLERGMTDTGIRALARAAGTSDRMLIYYFGTREAVVDEALGLIVQGLEAGLDAAVGDRRRAAGQLFDDLLRQCADPALQPTIRLWFEIVGLAARGVEPYRSRAHGIAGAWLDWIERRLVPRQRSQARDLLARLEGELLLRLIEPGGSGA